MFFISNQPVKAAEFIKLCCVVDAIKVSHQTLTACIMNLNIPSNLLLPAEVPGLFVDTCYCLMFFRQITGHHAVNASYMFLQTLVRLFIFQKLIADYHFSVVRTAAGSCFVSAQQPLEC